MPRLLGMALGGLAFLGLCPPTRGQEIPADDTTVIVAPGAEITLHPPAPTHRAEATIDGGLLVPVRGVLRAPETGAHWLTVVSRDPAGNPSELRWIRLVVDDEAPTVELDFSSEPEKDLHDDQWLPAGVTVGVLAVDRSSGIGGVTIAATGGPGGDVIESAGETEATIRLTAEGEYEIRAQAIDVVENRSEPLVGTYRVDGTGPEGEVFAEGPHVEVDGLLVVGPDAEVHVRMNDSGSGLVHWSALLDGEAVEKEAFHRGWPPGRHEAGAHMMDRVGNHALLAPRPFFYDAGGPEIAWEIETETRPGCEDRPLVVPPVRLRFAASDTPAGISSFETSLDGTTWLASEGHAEVTGDRLLLRAEDAVGNTTRVEAIWDLDLEPPSLALISPDGVEHAPGSQFTASYGDILEVAASDDGCHVPEVRYFYEDDRFAAVAGRSIPITRAGCFIRPFYRRACRITVEATDQYGRRTRAIWRVEVEGSPSDGGGT